MVKKRGNVEKSRRSGYNKGTDENKPEKKHNLDETSDSIQKKKRKKETMSTSIYREPTPNRIENREGLIAVMSANVAGLRGVINNSERHHAFRESLSKADPDIFCIQEHKLQESHVSELNESLTDLFKGYDGFFYCSKPPAKKGYSGVACFLKRTDKSLGNIANEGKEIPAHAYAHGLDILDISYGLGEENKDDKIASYEGRVITLELPSFYILNIYTPNSGQHLGRLEYRTKSWDQKFLNYVKSLEQSKPVICIGDLNVAHGFRDMHNFYTRPEFPDFDNPTTDLPYKGKARPLLKQAGCTVEERNSFTEILSHGLVDTFRHFHPTAQGCFSYWSMRAGNRIPNKGLRLDYALASNSLCSEANNPNDFQVVDSFVLDNVIEYPAFSDHCMIGVYIKNKGSA